MHAASDRHVRTRETPGPAAKRRAFCPVVWVLRRVGMLGTDCGGAALIEFGIVAPLLLGLLSPVVDVGLACSRQLSLQRAAEAGAQYASLTAWSSTSSPGNIEAAANAATTLALTWAQTPSEFCGCPNATGSAITNTGTPPCSGTPSGCAEPAGYYVTFRVTASYTPVMPFSVLPNPTTLSAQPVIRVQ